MSLDVTATGALRVESKDSTLTWVLAYRLTLCIGFLDVFLLLLPLPACLSPYPCAAYSCTSGRCCQALPTAMPDGERSCLLLLLCCPSRRLGRTLRQGRQR